MEKNGHCQGVGWGHKSRAGKSMPGKAREAKVLRSFFLRTYIVRRMGVKEYVLIVGKVVPTFSGGVFTQL